MKTSGQIIFGALGIMLVLAITVPMLIRYIQQDSTWTQKQVLTTQAFQLAESAVEQGFQQLILSTAVWSSVQTGTIPSGYNFNKIYTAGTNGQYEIRYAAGPGASQLTITGVGKIQGASEIRALKVVYTNSGIGNNSITAGNTVTIGASVNVEWGAVISYTNIVAGGRAHPRFYSSGDIDLDANGPSLPNTDNKQWWAYDTNLASQPQIDLAYYKTLAQSYGAAPAGCPSYYSNPGAGVSTDISGCIDTSNRTYYFETGDWVWKNPGPNFISGNIIMASGNMSISGNGGTGAAQGTYAATIPPQAWMEYANDWATYTCMDAYANTNFATYADAVAASYMASVTHTIPSSCVNSAGSVLVHGFIYAGGGTGLNGGGNARFHGVVITPNTVTVNSSNYTIYFDNTVASAIRTLTTNLSRVSWQELTTCSWSGSNPTCP